MSLFDSDDKTFDSSGAELSAERPASSIPAGGREGEGDSLAFYNADVSRLKASAGSGSKSTVVKDFCKQLNSVLENKPPISRAKVQAITKSALAAGPYYKHIVCNIERFIQKCKSEYKLPGLYLIDSVVRQSRHQFGAARDVFGPRFLRNIETTFRNLIQCSNDDKKKIIRVLNLWQRGAVFPDEKITMLMQIISEPDSAQTPKCSEQQTDKAHSTEVRRIEDFAATRESSTAKEGPEGKTVGKVLELQDALSCLQRAKSSGVDIKSLLINKEGNLRSIDNSLIKEIHQLTSQLLDDQGGNLRGDGPNCPAKRRMNSPIDRYVQNKETKPDFAPQGGAAQLLANRDCVDHRGPYGNDVLGRSDTSAISNQGASDYAVNSMINAGQMSEKEPILKAAMPEYPLEQKLTVDPVVSFPNVFPSAQLPMVNIPQYSQFFPQPRVVAAAPSRPATCSSFESVGNSAVEAGAAKLVNQPDYKYRPLQDSFSVGNVACADKFSNAAGSSYANRGPAASSEQQYRSNPPAVDVMARSALQMNYANVSSQPLPAARTRFDMPQPLTTTSDAVQRSLPAQPSMAPWDPSPVIGWRPGLSGDKRAYSRPLLPTPKIGCTSVDAAANMMLAPNADVVNNAMFRQPQQTEPSLSYVHAGSAPVKQPVQQPDKDERRPLSPSQCQFSRQTAWPSVRPSSFKAWPDRQTSSTGFVPTAKAGDDGASFWQPPNEKTDHQQFVDVGKQLEGQEQATRRDLKCSWSDENEEAEQPRRLSLNQRIEAAVRSPPYSNHRSSRHPAKDRSSSRKDNRLRSESSSHEMKRRHFHQTEADSASYVERIAQDRDERHDTSTYNDDSSPMTDKYQRNKTDSVRYKQSREPISRRERDRERRQLELPPLKEGHMIVCSKTVWLGHLPKMVSESEIRDELQRMGTISDIKLVPPRGCAFVCFENRRHAARCVEKMRKDTKILGNLIKLCWAVNIGVKDKFDKWDSKYGCTYVPIDEKLEKMSGAELIALSEGGLLDEDSMPASILAKVKAARDEMAAACEAAGQTAAATSQQQSSVSAATSTGETNTPPLATSSSGEAFQRGTACSSAAPIFQAHQSPFAFLSTAPNNQASVLADGSTFNLDVGFRCNSAGATADSQPRPWAINTANGAQFAGFQRVVIQHGPSFPAWSRPPVASTAYFGSALPASIAVNIPQVDATTRRHYSFEQNRACSHNQGNSSQEDVYTRQTTGALPPDQPVETEDKTSVTGNNGPARDSPYGDERTGQPDAKPEKSDHNGAQAGDRTSPNKAGEQSASVESQIWKQCNFPEKTALLQAPPMEGEKTPLLPISKEALVSNAPVEPPAASTSFEGRVETPVDEAKAELRLDAGGNRVPSQPCLLPANTYNMPDMSMPPPAVMQQQYSDRFGTPVRTPYRGGRMRPSPPTPFPFYRPNPNVMRQGWNGSFGPQFYGSRNRCGQNAFPMYNDGNVEQAAGFAQDGGRRGFRGSGRFNTRYRWPNAQRFPQNSNFQQVHGPRGRGEGRGGLHAYPREEHYAVGRDGGKQGFNAERSSRPSILGDPPALSGFPPDQGGRCQEESSGEPPSELSEENLADEQCRLSPRIDEQAPAENEMENSGSL